MKKHLYFFTLFFIITFSSMFFWIIGYSVANSGRPIESKDGATGYFLRVLTPTLSKHLFVCEVHWVAPQDPIKTHDLLIVPPPIHFIGYVYWDEFKFVPKHKPRELVSK
jgi:hypothetical protein